MSSEQIQALEKQLFELGGQLRELQQAETGREIPDYSLRSLDGTVTLRELFGDRNHLLAIHNMGQGCRYCTLWADGINAFLPHLESAMAVVLLSKDDPETQRRFANSRGWRLRMASHGGGEYIQQQTTEPGEGNMPGVVCYELRDDKIYRKNGGNFGPGDQYCSFWNLIGLAGMGESEFTPQYNYWQRPQKMDDGGENLVG